MSHAGMPLYIKEYLANTCHLSAAEHGAFLLLLMHRRHHGSLPADDEAAARVCRLTSQEWLGMKSMLMEMFARERWGATVADRVIGIGLFRPSRPAIPVAVKQAVKARDSACRYCGQKDGPFEIDHIMPWSRGGKHEESNLVLACLPCNRSKGAMTPDEWLQ